MWFLLLLLLPGVRMQDDDLSSKDHHYRLPFNAVQFVEHKSSKNGPILFPNDAPPPPPTPLIVTSRPLIESIARSELNPNNSVAAQSQFHQVQYKPDYLTRTRTYTPYTNGVSSTPVYDYRPPNVYIVTTARPEKENFYKEYEDQSSEHLNYGGGPGPENSKEYNHGENYAFSYTVKDHKTGDDFSHSQQSTGSATNGEYRVRLPDGRMQIVSYTADENGYNAKVRYDEHTTPDNNLDVDVTKGNVYHPPTPITYKHLDKVYTDNNKDSFENDEYIRQRYNDDKIVKSSAPAERPVFNDIQNNYYGPKQNDFQNYKPHYETTKSVNKDRADDLTDTNNEFLKHFHQKLAERNKLQRTKDEDYFKFSQEIADYSSELGLHGNKKHKAKYADFESPSEGEANGKVTPTYEELKELFASNGNRQQHVVSTARPYDDVTDNLVVEITPRKPNLYTNVNYFNNLISATPSPFPFPATATTPSSYLYSTIANLKHRLSVGHKPVLSHQYINKINKYLMYK